MNLKKAIEYLDLETKGLMDYTDPNWPIAVKLVIEAGKLVKQLRDWRVLPLEKKLPGETED